MIAFATGAWHRINNRTACPCCGHKGHCTVAPNGDAIKCMRVQSNHPAKGGGWMHPVPESAARMVQAMPTAKQPKRLTPKEIELLVKQQRTAVNPKRLIRFADSLGVSVKSLVAYGIGWDGRSGCWAWPMYDGERKLCGIRLRRESGGKFCVPGSRNGLFIPSDFTFAEEPLMLPEGPTDAGAARDMGFRAVGRPSCHQGADLLRTLLQQGPRKQSVVVLAENDGPKWSAGLPSYPGIEGALACCAEILPACGECRFLLPPEGVKDLRDWKGSGATADAVLARMASTPLVTPGWLHAAAARMERKKAEAVKQET